MREKQKSTLKQIATEATNALVLVLNNKIRQTKIKNNSKLMLFLKEWWGKMVVHSCCSCKGASNQRKPAYGV
jgi:hypothetical protein